MGTTTALMNAAGTLGQAFGNVQSGSSAAAAGLARQQAANYQAASLRQQAMATRGQASQQAEITSRDTQLTLGTLRARAAASGAGAVTPTTVSLQQGIAGRGEYNALSALYSGEESARGEENQAALDEYMGTQEAKAGKIEQGAYNTRALQSIMTGASTLFSKYGGGGFSTPAANDETLPSMAGATAAFS